jgi:hypothetical protein
MHVTEHVKTTGKLNANPGDSTAKGICHSNYSTQSTGQRYDSQQRAVYR